MQYHPGAKVVCPHCRSGVKLESPGVFEWPQKCGVSQPGLQAQRSNVAVSFSECPLCEKLIVEISEGNRCRLMVPRVAGRRPVHPSVPAELRVDYDEAALVLADSPKSSAALARRCLQLLLVKQGAKKRNLVDQLEELYSSLPGYVQDYVDNIRKLGNLSAHAKRDVSTSEIVEVEPGEADWMLELLEELFDHYYAKPAEAVVRHEALNKKFADSGRVK